MFLWRLMCYAICNGIHCMLYDINVKRILFDIYFDVYLAHFHLVSPLLFGLTFIMPESTPIC